MRKFASIPPRIWQTELKAVRGDLEALTVYYHLTTSAHASMLGLYYIPLAYIAHEIGCSIEGASKGLRRLIQAGLCTYDFKRDLVWVHEMAADQIAPKLSPKDKRVKGVAEQLAMLPMCPITIGFYGRYRSAFHLHEERSLADFERAAANCTEAPSEPLRSKEKDKEKDLGEGPEPVGSGGDGDYQSPFFKSFDIPASAASARAFLSERGVPPSELDECVKLMMGGNFSAYDLEGVLENARNAA